ncbi:hypothetical protein AAG570_013662 [Ranatra chinensis]|uniref:Adenylate cyclase N-terminal domain-containing protein n=1 Tax=Ranatra chinensis TaxID=642074 RepID=A0ABD0YCU6_9HEMI
MVSGIQAGYPGIGDVWSRGVEVMVLCGLTGGLVAVTAVGVAIGPGAGPTGAVAAALLLSAALVALGPGSPLAPVPLFPLLVAVHTMLPLSGPLSLVMAATLVTVHMALAAVNMMPLPRQEFYTKLVAQVVVLCCGSGMGIYYRRMTDAAHRSTFSKTRTCIESRVKLECEKEQQEQLLLSVIPAYIAAEVSPIREEVS